MIIDNKSYTQINTNDSSYMIQNIGCGTIVGIFADEQPPPDATYQVKLGPGDIISNKDWEGIFYAKSLTFETASVGLTEITGSIT